MSLPREIHVSDSVAYFTEASSVYRPLSYLLFPNFSLLFPLFLFSHSTLDVRCSMLDVYLSPSHLLTFRPPSSVIYPPSSVLCPPSFRCIPKPKKRKLEVPEERRINHYVVGYHHHGQDDKRKGPCKKQRPAFPLDRPCRAPGVKRGYYNCEGV